MTRTKKEKPILNDRMTDTQWLTELYCKDYLSRTGRYVQTTFDPVSTHALYGVYSTEREKWKEILKENKGITRI